jgi:hypothetical protein
VSTTGEVLTLLVVIKEQSKAVCCECCRESISRVEQQGKSGGNKYLDESSVHNSQEMM